MCEAQPAAHLAWYRDPAGKLEDSLKGCASRMEPRRQRWVPGVLPAGCRRRRRLGGGCVVGLCRHLHSPMPLAGQLA